MILVIDDDYSVTASLGLLLRKAGHATLTASTPEEALDHLRTAVWKDVRILDQSVTAAFKVVDDRLRQSGFNGDTEIVIHSPAGRVAG